MDPITIDMLQHVRKDCNVNPSTEKRFKKVFLKHGLDLKRNDMDILQWSFKHKNKRIFGFVECTHSDNLYAVDIQLEVDGEKENESCSAFLIKENEINHFCKIIEENIEEIIPHTSSIK
jgi:hypothetical protein